MRISSLRYTNAQASLLALMGIFSVLYFVPFVGYWEDFYKALLLIVTVTSVALFILKGALGGPNEFTKQKLVLILLLGLFFLIARAKFNPFTFFIYFAAFSWPLILIVVSSHELIAKAFLHFRLMFLITVLPALVLYPVTAIGKSLFLAGTFPPPQTIKSDFGWHYNDYNIAYVLVDYGRSSAESGFFRMSGLFDEPGVIGTITALILAGTRLKKDWQNFIILIAGVLSFSLAFYVLTAVYFLASSKLSKIARSLLVVIPLLYLVSGISYVEDNVINRFEYKDGQFVGDNRTTQDFDLAFAAFVFSPDVWIGRPPNKDDESVGTMSWKKMVWSFGLVGTAIMIVFFLAYIFIKGRNNLRVFWPFVFVFLLSMYQRPFVLNATFMLIFAGALACLTPRK
jgi:hypothetical protein